MDAGKIVKELREYTYWCGGSHNGSHDIHPPICDAAADLIESLTVPPANDPMTLEELNVRIDPVWVPIEGDPEGGYWCLCREGEITPPSCMTFMAKDRPNWTFLRRKPDVYIGVDLASGKDFTAYAGEPERGEG